MGVVCTPVRHELERAGLPEFFVIGPMAVDLHPSYRIPDLIVVRVDLRKANFDPLPPNHAQLVVEVVSPGSRTWRPSRTSR